MIEDIVITIDDEFRLIAHRLDCELVKANRVNNVPMMTMFGIQNPIPERIKKHECLIEADV